MSINSKATTFQVIILAGGQGTRMHCIYPDHPKALVPLAGKPFIQWQLEWLAARGISSVHLATGHLSKAVQHWVEHNPMEAISISFSREPCPLGTGGGLKFTEPFIVDNPFMVLNGDSLLPNLDFPAMKKTHDETNGLVTIAITRIREAGRYGTVEYNANQKVTAFREKENRNEGWINGGVYLVNKQALNQVQPDRNISIESDIFPAMAQDGRLYAYPCPPPLLDMGTPEGIRAMEPYLLSLAGASLRSLPGRNSSTHSPTP